ncbi:hypothetical protein BDV33DRAFT_35978 [Aspergillus novoparasiticus]|uniref:Uncharacterized protein n=1 Tax=Aspergillus novoparasiticus TaxID=986946 RepID=A0A5N6EDB9_9EURO|nr:hypothetical protein BDV33DRAFT_35978 [Aspergillus novoparasiticus]
MPSGLCATLQLPPSFLLLGFLISIHFGLQGWMLSNLDLDLPFLAFFLFFSFLFFLSFYTSSFRSYFLYWGCGSSIRYLLS